MAVEKIEANVVVSLLYSLTLDDGSFVEETESDDPLMYLHGHENIIPGLERELEGLKVGDKKVVVVDAEDAYGPIDPDAFDEVPLSDMPDGIEPEEDMYLTVENEDGHMFDVRIAEVTGDSVVIDFNHPLAGERLHFTVEIVDLREADEEELDHGHVHGEHGHH